MAILAMKNANIIIVTIKVIIKTSSALKNCCKENADPCEDA